MTSALRRAFLAVEPPPAVIDAIEPVVGRLRTPKDDLRWTTRAQWHITLQFLGRVGDVEAVVDVVGDALRLLEPSDVRLGGGGAFPRPASASVLWLGLVSGRDPIATTAAGVAGATAALGYDAEDRFHPHVTFARTRKRRDLRPAIDAIGNMPVGPEWTVEEVVLFDSETRPEGARYTAVSRIPVGSSGRSAS